MMHPLGEIGKVLLFLGAFLFVLGSFFLLGGKLPWVGRLPGDILIEKKNVHFYFPLGTSLLLSLVLSFFLSLFWRK